MECGTTKRGSTGVHFSDRSWKMVEINRFHLGLSTVFWLFTIFVYFLLPLAPYFLNWPDDAFARGFWRLSLFTVYCGTDLFEALLFCLGNLFRVFYMRLLVQTFATWLKPVCWCLLMLILDHCLKPFFGWFVYGVSWLMPLHSVLGFGFKSLCQFHLSKIEVKVKLSQQIKCQLSVDWTFGYIDTHALGWLCCLFGFTNLH